MTAAAAAATTPACAWFRRPPNSASSCMLFRSHYTDCTGVRNARPAREPSETEAQPKRSILLDRTMCSRRHATKGICRMGKFAKRGQSPFCRLAPFAEKGLSPFCKTRDRLCVHWRRKPIPNASPMTIPHNAPSSVQMLRPCQQNARSPIATPKLLYTIQHAYAISRNPAVDASPA